MKNGKIIRPKTVKSKLKCRKRQNKYIPTEYSYSTIAQNKHSDPRSPHALRTRLTHTLSSSFNSRFTTRLERKARVTSRRLLRHATGDKRAEQTTVQTSDHTTENIRERQTRDYERQTRPNTRPSTREEVTGPFVYVGGTSRGLRTTFVILMYRNCAIRAFEIYEI